MFRLGRHLFLIGTLGAAVGVPYLTSKSGSISEVFNSWRGGEAAANQQMLPPGLDGYQSIYQPPPGISTQGPLGPMDLAVEGPPAVDMAEVFRFDVGMDWLITRWPHVSTRLADLDMQGYRVPLVTGVREDDLAGSLTYYFDKNQRVRRITFEGSTGDATRVVQLVTSRFKLHRETDKDAGLFAYRDRWSGDVLSYLHVRPAAVVRADDPHRRFHVSLSLRKDETSFLSRPLY
ncbi:MAG: DUF6690 family protein [Pirellulales bacterium]